MPEFFETAVDKFTFKVAMDRFYNAEGVWAKEENGRVRIRLSDFVQQAAKLQGSSCQNWRPQRSAIVQPATNIGAKNVCNINIIFQ